MKPYIFVLMLVVLAFSCSAGYQYIGIFGDDAGDSLFNDNLVDYEIATKSLTAGDKSVLVGDIDNDSIEEMVINDAGTIKIYNSTSLSPEYSYNMGAGSFSNMQIVDMDGDDYYEIAVFCEDLNVMHFVSWNGTDMTDRTVSSVSAFDQSAGHTQLSCNAGACVIVAPAVYEDNNPLTGTSNALYAVGVNTTSKSAVNLNVHTSSDAIYCSPGVRAPQWENTDGDADNEWIFSYINKLRLADNDVGLIFHINVGAGLVLSVEKTVSIPVQDSNLGAFESCPDELYMTSPAVTDWDGFASDLETVIAYADRDHDTTIAVYDSGGSEVDSWSMDGRMFRMSQPAIGRFFPDSDGRAKDICIWGTDNDAPDDIMVVYCVGNGRPPLLSDDIQLEYNITGYYSSLSRDDMVLLHTDSVTQDDDYDELVNTFGVWELDYVGTNELIPVFVWPYKSGAPSPSSIEGTGQSDFILLTSTAVYYVDDGLSNARAEISSVTINPCIDAVIKINSTMQVSVTADDPENDDVRYSVSMYDGTVNEIASGLSSYLGSGETYTFSGILNVTTGSAILRVTAEDAGSGETVSASYTFSVQNNGVEFGDCTSTFTDVTTPEDEDDGTGDAGAGADPEDDNIVSDEVGRVSALTGLGTTVTWLIIMAVVAGAIILVGAQDETLKSIDGRYKLIVIGLIELLMLVIGVKLGFISAGVIWTLIILGIVIVGLVVSSKFMSPSSPGG